MFSKHKLKGLSMFLIKYLLNFQLPIFQSLIALLGLQKKNGSGRLSIKLSSYRVGRTVLPRCAISEHILWKYEQRRW